MNKEKEREEFFKLSDELLEKLSTLMHGVNPGITINCLSSALFYELLDLQKTHPDNVVIFKNTFAKMLEEL